MGLDTCTWRVATVTAPCRAVSLPEVLGTPPPNPARTLTRHPALLPVFIGRFQNVLSLESHLGQDFKPPTVGTVGTAGPAGVGVAGAPPVAVLPDQQASTPTPTRRRGSQWPLRPNPTQFPEPASRHSESAEGPWGDVHRSDAGLAHLPTSPSCVDLVTGTGQSLLCLLIDFKIKQKMHLGPGWRGSVGSPVVVPAGARARVAGSISGRVCRRQPMGGSLSR